MKTVPKVIERTKKQRKTTAYHEAGHAVIGRVLTLHFGRATIRPNYAEATAGHVITHDPHACLYQSAARCATAKTPSTTHGS